MGNLLKQPIFFIGAPRSGTTIISEILFQHNDLAWPSGYQEKYPNSLFVNYLRQLSDNRFWRLIGNKKQLHGASVFNRFLFQPSECYRMWNILAGSEVHFSRDFLLNKTASQKQIKITRNYINKLVRGQGKSQFSAKLTGPPRLGYLLSIFPDAVFVLIRRNFIPSISSLMKVFFWKDLGMYKLWWSGPYDESEQKWAEQNKSKPHLITAYQLNKIRQIEDIEINTYCPNLLKIDYESFVTQPESVIGQILKHCGLSEDPQIGRFLSRNPVVSRNKKDSEYFEEEVLEEIRLLINNY